MPLSLNNLKMKTDKGRKTRASNVFTKLVTVVIKPGQYLREYIFETYTPNVSKLKYRTTISPLDPKNPDLLKGNAKVSVSCQCADFKYRWEVANHIQSAAKVKYSNGAMPLITNPDNKTSLCKHLVACMPLVLSRNTKDIDSYRKAEEKYNADIAKTILAKDSNPSTKPTMTKPPLPIKPK